MGPFAMVMLPKVDFIIVITLHITTLNRAISVTNVSFSYISLIILLYYNFIIFYYNFIIILYQNHQVRRCTHMISHVSICSKNEIDFIH